VSARRAAGVVAALVLAGALLTLLGRGSFREGAFVFGRSTLDRIATWRRALAREAPPFLGVAASQVGYPPRARKVFTAPRPFSSFRILRVEDGAVAFESHLPGRAFPGGAALGGGTAYLGEFSALEARGRYRIVLGDGLESSPFEVGTEVFDRAVRAVERALYYQRAFTAIVQPYAEGPWVHPSDAGRAPPGVQGGWHDAGDYSLYSLSTNAALFWLLEAYSDFRPAADDTDIPESGNGVPDLLDEARYGLNWLLSVQDGSGGFRNTTCAERYGPYGTNRPERGPPYRPGEVGTLATARAVGTLAYASAVMRALDPPFAERCLAAARSGEAYLEAHPGEDSDGPTCPAYRLDRNSQVGHDVRAYAAAGLLLATGDPKFRQAFEANLLDLSNDPSAFRVNWLAALLYLRAPAGAPERKEAIWRAIRGHAARARQDGEAHPFGWTARYTWGSLSAAFQVTNAFNARACLADLAGAGEDCEQALANVHYALGRNYLEISYLSGLPGVTRARRHAFHQWLAALRAEPFLFPGLSAGGPVERPEPLDISYPHARPRPLWGYYGDPAMPRDASTPLDGRFTDNDSWSTNEVSIEWQAVALYALYFAQWRARHP